jgi:hypothetical protein
MDGNDSFVNRRKAQEEEYFRKKESELLEKTRLREAAQANREGMAQELGVSDDEIIANLMELGYERDTLRLLHLVPLVQLAWAEGNVTAAERELILEAIHKRGVTEGNPAYAQFTGWLDTRPPEEFFDRTLRVIAALINQIPAEDSATRKREVLEYSSKIAEASGGMLSVIGLRSKVSGEERTILERIAKAFE